jgi:hypothetical protein
MRIARPQTAGLAAARVISASLASAVVILGIAAIARADVIVTVIDSNGSTTLPTQASPAGATLDTFSRSTSDYFIGILAGDSSPTSPGYLSTNPTVMNLTNNPETISVEIEDTWTGGAGFSNPAGSPVGLVAQLSNSSLPGSGTISMQGGFSSPVSNTPMSMTTPVLTLSSLGAVSTLNDVGRSAATYDLFTYLSFTLAPHATITFSAMTAVTSIPEPRIYVSLIGLACALGLGAAVRCRGRVRAQAA